MKLLCSILAFMILALSCIPCADASEMDMHAVSTTTHPGTAPSQEHEHPDLCSPFCQCSCCALVYALPDATLPEFFARIPAPRTPFASYLQQKPVGIAIPVWQPPQSA